jgi:hypothetical protein
VTELACRTEARRGLLRRRGINGIDTVEVGDDGVTLTLYFLAGAPDSLGKPNVRIDGGHRSPRLTVDEIERVPTEFDDGQDCIRLRLNRTGHACPYRLCLVDLDERGQPTSTPLSGFDPRYSCAAFSFTQICARDLDCAEGCGCTPVPERSPAAARDYLARDYQTFRRLLFDRMALVAPGWRERHIPDLGVTLVELLAYVADHLSYYQDAVATEAYLETARRRISVRRHGRLVDYVLGEGTNARAFVVVGVESTLEVDASTIGFVTGYPGVPPAGRALTWSDVDAARAGSFEEFHPLVAPDVQKITFWPGQDEIGIHTWGDDECCLPMGATSATLVENPGRSLRLVCGDFLLFEEVRGPRTGLQGDADPSHRHVVRLTGTEQGYDEATEQTVLQVQWSPQDALPFPLCLSALGPAPACKLIRDVSVARANVVLVDHGRQVHGELLPAVPAGAVTEACDGPCEPADVLRRAGRFRPRLAGPNLTHAEPLPAGDPCTCGAQHGPPAVELQIRRPQTAMPALYLVDPAGLRWSTVPDLLRSGPDDRVVLTEMDDERVAWLRFGDDRQGEEPEPGMVFAAHYRVGNGSVGNVGAGTIRYLVLPGRDDRSVTVRNPLQASGGVDPESVADAKLTIPYTFSALRERALTADDYAELAQRLGGKDLQSSAADLVWTGSWYTAEVALDPRVAPQLRQTGTSACIADDDRLERLVGAGLQTYRRMGHDLQVVTADLVPIHLELTACVAPHSVQAHVKAAVLDLLTAGVRRDGSLGLFHPDRWTFGQAVDASPIVAAVAAIAGVTAVEVTTLARAGESGTNAAAAGVLTIGRWEIAQLDPLPNRVLGGRLEITLVGGR